MNLDQIRQKVYFLTSTSGTDDFPDEVLVPEANNAAERIDSLIFQASGRWQWDDSNNADLNIATADLFESQQDYSLETSHLEISRMEVKDTEGNWTKLIPIDQTDLPSTSLTDYMKNPGKPIYYDKIANSIFLYPAPDYDQEESLKLYFQRGPSYFVIGENNKSPGFNTLYHDLIPLWVAYNFALANGKSNSNALMAEIEKKEDALKEDYALRDRDDPIRLRPAQSRWN